LIEDQIRIIGSPSSEDIGVVFIGNSLVKGGGGGGREGGGVW